MLLLGAAAWTGGLVAALVPVSYGARGLAVVGAILVLAALAAVVLHRRGADPHAWTLAAALVVLAAVAAAALVRAEGVSRDPVAGLADERAAVSVDLTVLSDPRSVAGRYGSQVLFRARVDQVTGRGAAFDVRAPVLVVGAASWRDVRLGARVHAAGRLAPSDEPALAAVLTVRGTPDVRTAPDLWWRAAERVRASLRASVQGRPADQRALVPALVVGDDAAMDPRLVEDVQTTGLTHLTAVSGTNLTLLVGFLLFLTRWVGVRGRGRVAVAAVGIAGFLLLARAEPSVLRAAAMGTVALVGLGAGGRRRGTRALGVAVVVLLLLDPWLASSVGFALSVLATAGILLLAPGWRDALSRWAPRWVAEAVVVPLSAQVACTPLVAAISGQVSLVAVAANLVVAPVVGPATVLGLAGALVGLIWAPLGTVLGTLASWCVAWIVLVAEHGARLPGAAVDWGAEPVSLAVLTVLCVGLAWAAPTLLRRRTTGLAAALLLLVSVVVVPPSLGWPPRGWLVVACDVGQGDALVVSVDDATALVIDAGPDAAAVDACLGRLDVDHVPLLVLTHFHADHVGGLSGVLDGRTVDEALVSPVADPPAGAADSGRALASAGVPTRSPAYGETLVVGPVSAQVLWPPARAPTITEGSVANNASLVLLVQVRGIRILLTGDIEPPAQAGLARTLHGLTVDVLKLPHHGSRAQDLDFLAGLRPRVVLVSVGADNDYGHPAPEALSPFEEAGAIVLRTDRAGDLAVVDRDGELAASSR